MKNSKLAENFARGNDRKKGCNMFIEGKALFSYGHHFCLAYRVNYNTYLFNINKYSSTTSKHQHYTLWALKQAGHNIIECDTKEIQQAINHPEEPIIITHEVNHTTIHDCLGNLKAVMKKQGLKRFPKKKFEEQINNMLILEKI